jgi:hypothetical protein
MNDNNSGFIWLGVNKSYEPLGKQPVRKGFVSIPASLLNELLNNHVTDERDCYMLDAALWVNPDRDNVIQGKLTIPQERADTSPPVKTTKTTSTKKVLADNSDVPF